jgi:enoyl-CoA hydratase
METYEFIDVERREQGVLLLTLNRPQVMNATNERMHNELSRIFYDIDVDPDVRVVVVTGAGGNFCAGGDLGMVEQMLDDHELLARQYEETVNLVYGIINCSKVIISAIEGNAVGAGLSLGLLADISIASETAVLNDGHVRLGVAAGDHAAMIWPLLCGMARAKYVLLTGDSVDGREAADIGLVSKAVPAGQTLEEALRVAAQLVTRAPLALSWTKRSLNSWLRLAGPAFEQSLALEMLSFPHDAARASFSALARRSSPKARPQAHDIDEKSM